MNCRTFGACMAASILILLSHQVNAQIDRAEDVKRLKYLNSLYIQSFVHSDTTTYDKMLWSEDFMQQNANGTLLLEKTV